MVFIARSAGGCCHRSLCAAEVVEDLAEGDEVLLGGVLKAGHRVRARAIPAAQAVPTSGKSDLPDAGSALTNAMGR